MGEEASVSEQSEDMTISPSSRGTSAETGKTGTWKLVTDETGDWTVGEDTGESRTDNTEVDGIVTGTDDTGADTEVGITGVDAGTVEAGTGVDGGDGSGVDSGEIGADVGSEGSKDVLDGPQACVQFRAV